MTMTLIPSPVLDRARPVSAVSPCSHESAHGCAPVRAAAATRVARSFAGTDTTTGMNLWLGGDVQTAGFGSKYATKRSTPGRLRGMT